MKLTLPAWAPRQAYLNGKWIDAPKSFAVADPATGFEIARVPNLDAADVNRAIDAAHTVQRDWAATTTKERSAILRRWFDLVIERAEEISSIITAEQGNHYKRRARRLCMALRSSSGLQRKESGPTGDHFRLTSGANAF